MQLFGAFLRYGSWRSGVISCCTAEMGSEDFPSSTRSLDVVLGEEQRETLCRKIVLSGVSVAIGQ